MLSSSLAKNLFCCIINTILVVVVVVVIMFLHTFSSSFSDFPYIGCYESACFKNTTSFTIPSINECTGTCNNESSAFAALEFGDTCYCGEFDCIDQSDTKRCDDKCGIPCQEDLVPERFCGGGGFIQVYQGKLYSWPRFHNCFNHFDMPTPNRLIWCHLGAISFV